MTLKSENCDLTEMCKALCSECNGRHPRYEEMQELGVCDLMESLSRGRTTPRAKPHIRLKTVALTESGNRCGDTHPRCTISDNDVDDMRMLHEETGIGYRRLAKLYGQPEPTVRDIVYYHRRVATPMRYQSR